MVRKPNRKYYFTVEGETEKWYLARINDLLRAEESAKLHVSIECKVQKSPYKFAKTVVATSPIEITHWFDYESSEAVHVKQFMDTLDQLKQSSSIQGKQIKYILGYSNLTFELWMILHKTNCSYMTHRDQYLTPINRAYDEKFKELDTYKEEQNFKRVLGKISLHDVRAAIKRAKAIMNGHVEARITLHRYKGYSYYKDNPSLTVHESVEKILKDCGLL
ncbi:RloB family protein [Paenibacillus sp. YYML68]|uniref:RloB family protein n=1 Tax=Paenibacillus sp. YYML68 TaxID=2909250 RepID=UPI002491B064|nr:RloB family protein [Paenibacillus sp. YYML68]